MIGITRDGDVVTIELQRPERRNALNTEQCIGIHEAVDRAVEDGARAVVLTGSGTSFCAGADLSGDKFAGDFLRTLADMLKALQEAPLPVIAAVNGPAMGAGVQLAIASDLRVAAPEARFGIPAAKLGVAVESWTIRRLASIAGGGPARRMLLACESLDADEALHHGLVDRIGDLAAAQAWAAEIAQLAPLSLAAHKFGLNEDGTYDQPGSRFFEALTAVWTSKDADEGRAARAEKRPPIFRGH